MVLNVVMVLVFVILLGEMFLSLSVRVMFVF